MNSVNNLFSKKYIKKYNDKIKYIGCNNKMTLEAFLLSRLFISLILFIILLLIPHYGLVLTLTITPLFYLFYTKILLDYKIEKRKDKLYNEAIVFYEMLKLSLNKTKDLKISLEIVSIKLGNSLSLEFQKLLKNNRYNNDLKEVLNKVIESMPNEDVRKSLIDLKESDDYVTTISKNIVILQDKNASLIKSNYQFKPIVLIFGSIIILTIMCVIIFNLYEILDFFKKIFG